MNSLIIFSLEPALIITLVIICVMVSLLNLTPEILMLILLRTIANDPLTAGFQSFYINDIKDWVFNGYDLRIGVSLQIL